MDKRQYPRFLVKLPTTYSGDMLDAEGVSINLSLGGCAVSSHILPQQGTYLYFRSYLPELESWVFIERGRVRWVGDKVFGTEFFHLSQPQREYLQTYLAELSRMSQVRNDFQSQIREYNSHEEKPMQEDGPERRKQARSQVLCPVTFTGEGRLGTGQLMNLSLEGAEINSGVTVPSGEYLRLQIQLPDSESTLKIESAPVRWTLDKKFGVEFIRIGSDEQVRLRKFMKFLQSG